MRWFARIRCREFEGDPMEYRSLGRSGLQVSVAGLGCNNFGMVIDESAG